VNKHYSDLVKQAEDAVSSVKDPALKQTAFEKILDDLLADSPSSTAGTSQKHVTTKALKKRSVKSARSSSQRKGPTLYVQALIDDGFFSKPKTIAELRDELGNSGHHIPITTLSGLLQRLCQKRTLRRQKLQDKGFLYSNW
jgi:hypothetical protein